jgi:Flp pilus assembly protein TadG
MSRAASTTPLRKKWRLFRRNRRGSAAVEFALVAPLFFALLFAILETGIMFFASQVLETMTANASRLIMTGTEQNSGTSSAADFHQKVCNQIPALFDCSSIYVDVQTVPAFSNVSFSSPIDANGIFTPPSNYAPGGSSSIVVVRVFYPWQLFVTGFGYNISNMAGSKRLLTATAVFQNEPY